MLAVMWRKGNPGALLVGVEIGTAAMEAVHCGGSSKN